MSGKNRQPFFLWFVSIAVFAAVITTVFFFHREGEVSVASKYNGNTSASFAQHGQDSKSSAYGEISNTEEGRKSELKPSFESDSYASASKKSEDSKNLPSGSDVDINHIEALLENYSSIKKVSEKINFEESFLRERDVNESYLLSTSGCGISKITYGHCIKCHGKFGENTVGNMEKPLAVMSAKEIFEKMNECKYAKDFSNCDKKFLANQIKGL